jgi:hypothetical protein
VSKPELRGLVADLVPTVPALAKVNRSTIPLLDENRALSRCTSKVLVPFFKTPIPDPDFPRHDGRTVQQDAGNAFVGLAGESRLNDVNTPYYHVQANAGASTIELRNPEGESFFAQAASPPKGVRPIMPDDRPPARPGIPCETQEPPDMAAPGGDPSPTVNATGPCSPSGDPIACIPLPRRTEAEAEWEAVKSYLERTDKGLPAIDPLIYSKRAFDTLLEKTGLKIDSKGKQVPDPKSTKAPPR